MLEMGVILPVNDKFYLFDFDMIYCDYVACINSDINTYHVCINYLSTILQRPLTKPSPTTYPPISQPLASPYPPLNKTTTPNYFGMLFCILDLVIVYLFADACMHIINFPSHEMNIITFKRIQILLIIRLPTTKQLQYWCLKVCNVIELEILWRYNDWCWFASIQIDVMMVEIDIYDIIDYKLDVMVSATGKHEFTVIILIIDGSVTPQTIGKKLNIITQKSQGMPSLIPPSDGNQNDDARSDMNNVPDIQYHTVIVADITDHGTDAIDPITLEIDVYGIIDCDFVLHCLFLKEMMRCRMQHKQQQRN